MSKLSPGAAGTLAALTTSNKIINGHKWRYGPASDRNYAELISAGFVRGVNVLGSTYRYELLCDVEIQEPQARHGAPLAPVSLSDEQREMLARERQNDREISRAIANGKYEQRNFSNRCIGNYEAM